MLKRTRLIIALSFIPFFWFFRDNRINTAPFIPDPAEIEVVLNEAPDMEKSENDTWWLNSGGRVYFDKNIIKTIQGGLPAGDYWRLRYNESNPTETDDGYHPQNIFRLVTKQKYEDITQYMYFKIKKYILSNDVHRTASNGVLFFHHYLDGDNLYYGGLRVDGNAVIKKKVNGQYFTMAYVPVFTESTYNRETNPNLLPLNKLIGLKTEIQNIDTKTVSIKLYLHLDESGVWQQVAETIDNGQRYGGEAILESGYAGIRSDFMDVEFKDYTVNDID